MAVGDARVFTERARGRALIDELKIALPKLETMSTFAVRRLVLWLALHYTKPDDRTRLITDILEILDKDGE